jgi:hypothetical protein
MNDQEIVIKVLEEFYPDECDIAGPANVRRLAAGTTESIRVNGGSYLDMGQVIGDLSTAVVFITGTLSILRPLVGSARGFPPNGGGGGYGSPAPVVAAASEDVPGELPAGMDPETSRAIRERLIELLRNDPGALGGDPGEWGGR